ncbi:MAG TPA: glycosyltransferase family 39 protein [Planctomycetaceae bacterium]|nr:glycosyltransferase family 39 protein [Planctomycetaceae bacterium]
MTDPDRNHRSIVLQIGAALWIGLFFVWFFTRPLPNQTEYSRLELWEEVPLLLTDFLPHKPEPGSVPSGWEFFPQRIELIAWSTLVIAGVWGIGNLMLRLIGLVEQVDPIERRVLSIAAGASIWSTLVLILGLAGAFSRTSFIAILATSFVIAVACSFRGRKPSDQPREPLRLSGEQVISLIAMLIFLGCMLLGALLPSIDFDVKEYHLQGPKEWFLGGQITYLEHNVYTSFPFLTEMLSLSGMVVTGDWFSGALVGKGVLMTFAPLTSVCLYCLGKRWYSPRAGWLAALVHLSTPWVYRVSIIAYTEGALLFYTTAGLLAFDIARRDAPSRKGWQLVGLMSGAAMACKYPGLISAVIPLGVAMVWTILRAPESAEKVTLLKKIGKPALAFGGGVLVAVGPWLLKNAVQTGNPVYPLAWTIFGGTDWNAERNNQWRAAHAPPGYRLSDIPGDLAEVAGESLYHSPLLFALAPLAFLCAGRGCVSGWVWVYLGWLFVTWWVLTHRIDRFWLPIVPLAALLAGAGLDALQNRGLKLIGGFAVVAALIFNLALIGSPLIGLNTYLADLDTLKDSETIQPPGILFLNRNLKPGEKALLVGEANVFDARFPLAYNTVFDDSLLERWCGRRIPGSSPPAWELLSPEEIRANFKREGITHVLVNWSEILRYRLTYRYTGFVLPERLDTLVELGILSPPELLRFKAWNDFSVSEQKEIVSNLGGRLAGTGDDRGLILQEVYRVVP